MLFVILLLTTSSGCYRNGTLLIQSEATITVDGNMALASLTTISNGHLQKLVDEYSIFSNSPEVRSGNWSVIRGPFIEIVQRNIAALNWFALPDGTYWTVQEGRAKDNLTSRAYWNRVMKGQIILGDLVVSKATGRNTAIIAVPVLGPNKTVTGVLGASVYLDKLSRQIKEEMSLDDSTNLFYAIDSSTQIALNSNTNLIFKRPREFSEELQKIFAEMVTQPEGSVTYVFKGVKRTVLYRKSPVVNWWYAIGTVIKK